MATQQLLLDTYNMKAVLTQLPQLVAPSSDSHGHASSIKAPPAMYLKLVNNKIAHIEMILKLVGTPEDMLLERFRIMWPDGQPSDLQLLMSLKGTKRNDQQVILEMLGLSAAGKMLNKTAHTIFNVSTGASDSSSASAGGGGAGGSGSSNAAGGSTAVFGGASTNSQGGNVNNNISNNPSGNNSSSSASAYSAASAAAASAAALSSMKNLTLDISSSARSAVGNLKWSTATTSTTQKN